MAKRYGWLLLILLAAASLRLAFLSEVPPGLTHDEADHGLDAWGVVNGVRPIYFSVGYGREPLYDYATAGLMTFLGPTYLAGRLISAYFSLILIAGSYAWAHRAFNRRTALLAAAGLAVSFWAVMTGRQALRSVTMPALFVLSAYFFWQALDWAGAREWELGIGSNKIIPDSQPSRTNPKSAILSFLGAGILLGITFYTYIPARVMWVIFPLLLLYLALANRELFAKAWRGTAVMLLVAAAIALPLLVFLATNPSAETRLEQLSDPLTKASDGNFEPLLDNVVEGLRLLSIEGDSQWRYNLSGRPLLPPLVSVLFIMGLGLALWWLIAGWGNKTKSRRSAAAFFALSWLALGLAPAFITGSELSTTQAIGALPILFVFPAIAIAPLLDAKRFGKKMVTASTVLIVLLITALFAQTAKAYFVTWANEPQVRVQYETTLVSAIDYLNEMGQGPASISTTTPNRFHSPAVATMTLDNPAVQVRWFDGQSSLLVPDAETSTVIFTGFAPLSSFLEKYFEAALQDELPLRSTDLDRPLSIYEADGPALLAQWKGLYRSQILEPAGATYPVQFGQAVELVGYDLQTPAVAGGGEVRLVTFWQVKEPLDDAVFFTHILGPDGQPVAQADRLDAPSYFWVNGDVVVQLHQIQIPDTLAPGEYPIHVGLYTRADLQRLPIVIDGTAAGDHVRLPSLTVTP